MKFFLSAIIVLSVLLIASCKKEEAKDTTAPAITLKGDNPQTVGQGTTYIDPGATATDDVDGDISTLIQSSNNINMNVVGNYSVKYNVSDNAGNPATEVTRVVKVVVTK